MFFNSISIGDRLEIYPEFEDNKNDVHISQIENIIDKDKISVHVPITYLNKKGLLKNVKYTILIFTVKGVISFIAVIESYVKEEGFNLMIMKLLTSGEKVQRRGFFRFSCLLPFRFEILETKENNDDLSFKAKENNIFYGVLVDLSGGGIRFLSNEDLEGVKSIRCDLKLYNDLLVIIGEIIQKNIIYDSEYKYQYRVVFTGILPKEQEKIIKFIFNEQRRIMHRIDEK